MTIQYTELLESRKMSRQKGSFTASRVFMVYDDDGDFLSITDAINYSDGVTLGESHPDVDSIFANGFTINAHRERKYTWAVTWNYAFPITKDEYGHDDKDPDTDPTDNTDIPIADDTDVDPPDDEGDDDDSDDGTSDDGTSDDGSQGGGGEGGTGVNEDGSRAFNGVSITTGLSLVDGFVAGATVPAGGAGGSEIAEDDGDVVHEGGEPITIPVPTAEMSFSETVYGTTFYLNNVQMQGGKRNDASFKGFAEGSVIFKGMSVQKQASDMWDVTYNFVWDAWSHCRQIAERNEDGELVWSTDDPPVLKIFWKQPFPETTGFGFSP